MNTPNPRPPHAVTGTGTAASHTGGARTTKNRADKLDGVLAALRTAGSATVSELVAATGYSRPTVTTLLHELRILGVGAEAASAEGGELALGRPASLWTLASDAGVVVGIDLLETSALVAVASLSGRVLGARVLPLSARARRERADEVVAVVQQAVATYPEAGPLRHLTVSTTGVVDDAGTVVHADLVPHWSGFDLGPTLSQALGVSVSVGNDINMAALGEFHTRRQDGRIGADGDLLYVQFSPGVHTGLVLGGAVHRGHQFSAGEISDVLDLRLDEDADADAEWAERAALTIASVGAVVDPDVIVISAPTPRSLASVSQVLARVGARCRSHSPALRSELADLGWGASVTGALHTAFDAAHAALGTATPRPVTLTGTDTITAAIENGDHTTLISTPSLPH